MVVSIPQEVRPSSQWQRRCGKPTCRRCEQGPGHGPYWYGDSRGSDGKLSSHYLGKVLPPGVVLTPRQQRRWAELLALRAGQHEQS